MSKFALIAVAAAFAGIASAQSITIATFDDPSASSAKPLFSFSGGVSTTGMLTGSWGFAPTETGLTLRVPGSAVVTPVASIYNDARFTFDNGTDGVGVGFTAGVQNPGSGRVRFYDNTGTEVLRIRFSNALYSILGTGAASLTGGTVDFQTPAAVSYGLTNGAFAFSFANQALVGSEARMTSSFTSSAVPEPMTMGLIALGAAGLAARRRKSR
ncbi:MAG: PEP-CTERM sorting domain-containing protein [Fimbriimonadaceae bacterium]|jgi:hypothetical protein|nr:PEP-CTERM sorting domain-containing protein [Fimbriimonadaceae bacterium]